MGRATTLCSRTNALSVAMALLFGLAFSSACTTSGGRRSGSGPHGTDAGGSPAFDASGRVDDAGEVPAFDSGNPSRDAARVDAHTPTTGTVSCCLNQIAYDCASPALASQCAGETDFDWEACVEACPFDDVACLDDCDARTFTTPMPEVCTRAPERDGTCGLPPLCRGTRTGDRCDRDIDCASNNCFESHCYSRDTRNPCERDIDCNSNNCYMNCCADRTAGSPCERDIDCNSNNCFDNECQ